MRKFVLALMFVVLFPMAAVAQQPVPTVKNVPNFLGTWTLGLFSGRMVDLNGYRQEFPSVELTVNVYSAQQNEGGSTSYVGNVVGHSGSVVNVFYNPAFTPRYVEMYAYIPEPELTGSSPSFFLQVNCRMFISPDGGYLYGEMSATFYDNVSRSNGGAVPVILYDSGAVMSRPGGKG